MTIFEDNFTDGIKSEWEILQGSWIHNSILDAYSTDGSLKNTLELNYSVPDDSYVEFKIISVDKVIVTYIYLLTRSNWEDSYPNSGYAICYNKIYSDYYGIAFYLTYYINGSQKDIDPVFVTWDELEGFNDITDLEGHTIGIKCEGDVIKGYLDNKEILSKIYTHYSNGIASIIVKNVGFTFDNFKIMDTMIEEVEEDPIEELNETIIASMENVNISDNPNQSIEVKKVSPYLHKQEKNINGYHYSIFNYRSGKTILCRINPNGTEILYATGAWNNRTNLDYKTIDLVL